MRPENMMSSPINSFSGMTFEQAQGRQQQRDIKSPEEAKAIADAIARGPTGNYMMGSGFRQEGDMARYIAFNDPGQGGYGFSNAEEYNAANPNRPYGVAQDPNVGSSMQGMFNIQEAPRLFEEGGVAGLMMKKNEKMKMPADRSKLVLNRILQQGGKPNSNDPRLMAQLNTILGRKST
jgi:hypothetical protein